MRRFALLLLALLIGAPGAPAQADPPQKEVWMMPPGPGPQEPPSTVALRDFFLHPDDWKQTRAAMTAKTVGVFGSTVNKMNKAFSPAEIGQFGRMLAGWNLKFGLEIESVKGGMANWDTGQGAFDRQSKGWDDLQAAGLPIYSFAMDEPYCSVVYGGHKPIEFAVQETANFIALMRQHYPDAKVGDIEPMPDAFTVEQLLAWVDALQAKLKEMNVRGLDFFRLDYDWTHLMIGQKTSWRDIKQLENGLRARGMPFSLVYWAPPFSYYQRMGIADDSLWHTFVMWQGYAYALIGGSPDQYVMESWVGTPSTGTPETDPNSFSYSMLDLCNKFVLPDIKPSGL